MPPRHFPPFHDEVFRMIALDGEPMPSVIDVVEQAVSIGDMSKPWGLGGLRVGWIASREHDHAKVSTSSLRACGPIVPLPEHVS